MRYCAILTLVFVSGLFFACIDTPQKRKDASSPALLPSKQVQQKFFACKDLIKSEWIGVGEDFSTDDEKLIIVSRLDPAELNSTLMVEIISPEDEIVEKESHDYEAIRDVGIYFDPVKLVEQSGAGRYRAYIYADSRPVGRVYFFIQDLRQEGPLVEEARNPELSGIQWETPSP